MGERGERKGEEVGKGIRRVWKGRGERFVEMRHRFVEGRIKERYVREEWQKAMEEDGYM